MNSTEKCSPRSSLVALIPARYGSTRFAKKMLAPIDGIPMIVRVSQNVAKSGIPTFVVTDSVEIEEIVTLAGGKVLRVDDEVRTGTERVAVAYKRYFAGKEEFKHITQVINVQGDEPLTKENDLTRLADFMEERGEDFDLFTLVRPRMGVDEEFLSSGVVKVAYNEKNHHCFYFSRAPIPHYRQVQVEEGEKRHWYQHIGIYGYSTQALLSFLDLPSSPLERYESLEQLRFLEEGKKIGAVCTQSVLVSVDYPEDIQRVEGVLRGQK